MNDMHLVMHGLAIKKHARPEDVASGLGLDLETVRATLEKLVAAHRVVEAQGRYLLAPAARMLLSADYSRYYESVRANPAFRAGYAGIRAAQWRAETAHHRLADGRRARPARAQRPQRQGLRRQDH